MSAHRTSSTLVGRTRELAQLDAAVAAAEADDLTTVMVSGEAGVGKSRLVSEFSDRARDRGLVVATGACLRIGDEPLPYAAVTDVLRGLVRDMGADRLRAVAGAAIGVLRPLVPSLGGRHTGAALLGPDAEEAQLQVHGAFVDLVERLAEPSGLLLVMEDIHWADRATRDLVGFLSRTRMAGTVLVVATHRRADLEPGHPLRTMFAELRRLPGVGAIDLAPFDRACVDQHLLALLGEAPPPEVAEVILARSQGNPFYIEELVAAGAVSEDSPLPSSLREVVLTSLDGLNEGTRRLLRTAALAGQRVHHDLLHKALPDLDVDAALRSAVDHRVLVSGTVSGTYAFRHILVAEAVASTVLSGEREALHRRLAEILEGQPWLAGPAPAAELAAHWAGAGDLPRSLAASVAAAREAEEMHAVAEACTHLERALAGWWSVSDPAQVAGATQDHVIMWLARLCHLSGRPRRGEELLRPLLADRVVDGVDRADALVTLGHCLDAVGDGDAARRAWDEAVASVTSERPSAVLARALATRAASDWERDPEPAAERAGRAIAMAATVGDTEAEATALIARGGALAHLGRIGPAVDDLDRARRISDPLCPAVVGRAHVRLSAILIRGGRASDGADEALHGVQRVRELGVERTYAPWLLGNALSGLFWAGRWSEATELLDRRPQTDVDAGFGVVAAARLLAHRGDTAGARRVLEEGAPNADTEPRLLSTRLTIAVLSGAIDEGRALVAERHGVVAPHAATVNELRAWALRVEADAGWPDPELRDLLLAETTMQRSAGVAHAEPWRRTATAEHARGSGRAVAAWEDAVAAWDDLAWPYQTAYARYRLVEARLHADEDVGGEGADALLSAEDITHHLGARPLHRAVVELGRRVGVTLPRRTPNRRSAAPGYGLTRRESEVLALVVEGLTNPDIGERLFISRKTASAHVSNILRKLGASGRTEAAALAVREALV